MGSSTQAYGEPWYWNDRYAKESLPFDWYQKYHSLAPLINLYAPDRHCRVLVVGCGSSVFSEGMVDDGFQDVVNVDISSVVIQTMVEKYSDKPQLKYLQMDVRDMGTFPDCSFNAVVDKGTLDSLLITYGAPIYRMSLLRSFSWTIKLHVIEKLASEENSKKPKWDLIKPVPLDYDGCSVEAVLGKNPDVHYIYVCTKDEF